MIITKALGAISSFVTLRNFLERGQNVEDCAARRMSYPIGMKDTRVNNPTPCMDGTTHCLIRAHNQKYDYEICKNGVFVKEKCPCPKETCRPGGLYNECEDLTGIFVNQQGVNQKKSRSYDLRSFQGQGNAQGKFPGLGKFQGQGSAQSQGNVQGQGKAQGRIPFIGNFQGQGNFQEKSKNQGQGNVQGQGKFQGFGNVQGSFKGQSRVRNQAIRQKRSQGQFSFQSQSQNPLPNFRFKHAVNKFINEANNKRTRINNKFNPFKNQNQGYGNNQNQYEGQIQGNDEYPGSNQYNGNSHQKQYQRFYKHQYRH